MNWEVRHLANQPWKSAPIETWNFLEEAALSAQKPALERNS